MGVFFIITFQSLWLKELTCTEWSTPSIARSRGLQVVFGLFIVGSLPWIAVGWRAVNKSSHRLMAIFLVASLLLAAKMLFLVAGADAVIAI
jgi:uncharacterized membrane protein